MTYCAAKASESAFFVAPAHVTVQRVLHDVGAFKLVASDIRDGKHANQHGGQRKKRQKQHVCDLIK